MNKFNGNSKIKLVCFLWLLNVMTAKRRVFEPLRQHEIFCFPKSLGTSESEGPKYCARYKLMYVPSMILEIES